MASERHSRGFESGPFGLLDTDLVRYFIDFHIGADYIRRNEIVPDEIVDYLVEKRRDKLAQTSYREDREASEKNLEFVIRQIGNENARGHGRFREIEFEGEPAVSHEHNPATPISKIQKRVKLFESYWVKSMVNVARQNETGHYDHLALRILVECEEARLFRMFRERETMGRPDRERYLAAFGPKPVTQLEAAQREEYLSIFRWEYSDLSAAEKKAYRQRWADKHRQMCLDLAEKIADSVSWNTIPVRPHYGSWNGIAFRAQTQNVFSRAAEKIASIDYLFFEDKADSASFMNHFNKTSGVASSVGRIYPADGSLRRISDRLLVRLSLMREDFDELEQELYLAVVKKNRDLDHKRLGGKYTHDEYLVNLRLGLSDVPGQFIYAETTTVDLEEKYPGFVIDRSKSREMFVKSYIGDERKANDYETATVFISLDEARQIAFEVQIRDYIMHDKATRGSAEHGRYKEEKVRDLSENQLLFGEAFFGGGNRGDAAFDTWYFRHLSSKLNPAISEIIANDLPSLPDDQFTMKFEMISQIYYLASCDLSKERKAAIATDIESLREKYLRSRQSRVIESRVQVAKIDRAFRAMNERYGLSLKVAADEVSLQRDLHHANLDLLFNAFSIYAHLEDPIGLFVSFYLGALIKDYARSYPSNSLERPTLKGFQQKVNALYADMTKTEHWKICKTSPIGYAPAAIQKGAVFAGIALNDVIKRLEDDERTTYLSGAIPALSRLERRMINIHENTRAYLQNRLRNS